MKETHWIIGHIHSLLFQFGYSATVHPESGKVWCLSSTLHGGSTVIININHHRLGIRGHNNRIEP